MAELPESLITHYRPATTHEVRTWSYGSVDRVRNQVPQSWVEQVGTLDDQRIFGPLRDYECACGKYKGEEHKNMICDRCGVKVMPSVQARRTRCAHIDLNLSVLHPLCRTAPPVEVISILPAAVWHSRGGRLLADLYDDMVRANLRRDEELISALLDRIVQTLLPIAETAHDWDLEVTPILGRGLLLAPRSE